MSIPTKEERAEWRRLASETMMISSLGEYTPEEFTTLLDAVDELEIGRDEAMKKLDECRKLLDECHQLSEAVGGQEDIRRMLKKHFDAETL